MKKWTALILIMILILSGLAGYFLIFGKQEPVIEVTEETVKLPILISGGDASWESCMEDAAKEYMQVHPETDVEIRASLNIENLDYSEGLLIEEALGDFDGIVEMRNVDLYAGEGKIVPLPEELTEQFDHVKEITGQVYSLPRFYTCRGIIYNKKIFEDLNLKEPKTYQEFLSLCGQLKNGGISPLVIGAGDRWHLSHWMNTLFTKDVKREYPDWIALRNEGKVHWTDEGAKNVIADFKNLFEKGYVDKDYRITTDAQTIEVLMEGQAAMLLSGSWMFSQILKADPEFEIGWFFLPDENGELLIETGENVGWSITASCAGDSKMYKAAVDFLEFYYSKDMYAKVLQNMNGISAIKETISYDALPVQKDIMELVKEKGKPEGNILGAGGTPEGFTNSMYDAILKLADGSYTVDETAEVLDKKWEKYLEKNK